MKTLVKSTIFFDEFSVDPSHRVLQKNGETIYLNPKTLDLLLALIERSGEIVSKDELLDAVWSGQFVEEGNLTVNISLLRKALGDTKRNKRYIVTVSGTGYKFIADLFEDNEEQQDNDEKYLSKHLTQEEQVGENNYKFRQIILGGGGNRLPVASMNGWQSDKPFVASMKTNNYYLIFGALIFLIGGLAGFGIYKTLINRFDDNKLIKNLTARTYQTDGMPRQAAISPSGKLLAYVGRKKGLDAVWVGDVSNGNNMQITEATGFETNKITFSPDEKFLYFVARQEEGHEWNLMRISIFGGAVQELIKNVHSAVSFSPDGERVAFIRRESEPERDSLIIADAVTGADERKILAAQHPQSLSRNGVSWSPDGMTIAVFLTNEKGEDCGLNLVNVSAGTKTRIGQKSWSKVAGVVWQKSGNALLAINPLKYGHAGSSEIWRITYPEGLEQKLTSDVNNYDPRSLSVSSDGKLVTTLYRSDPQIWISRTIENSFDDKKILSGSMSDASGFYGLTMTDAGKIIFSSSAENSGTLWQMNTDGSDQKQIIQTNKGIYDSQPILTEDNRYIIFQSNRSGEWEIWRAKPDGSDLKQLTSSGGNSMPTVTPDGKWVYFTHYEKNELEKIWRISIDGGKAEKFSDETADFATVSPDGGRIAASYGVMPGLHPPRIVIFQIGKGEKPINMFEAPGGILYNRLKWSPDGRAIVYKDTKQGLWRMNADSGEREKIELFDDFRVGHFAWSSDGKNFLYSGGVEVHELVILENIR